MANKKLTTRLPWITAALPWLVCITCLQCAESEQVADLIEQQQNDLRLKANIKYYKLLSELAQSKKLAGAANEICWPAEGVGTLTLNAIYGTQEPLIALLSYNSNTRLEATVGDTLLCGEKVITIAREHVVIEKQAQRYHIAGAATASPQAVPLPTPPGDPH